MAQWLIVVIGIVFSSVSFASASGGKIEDASVKASSFEKEFNPEKAIDGNSKSRWSSEWADPQWIMLDFGKKVRIGKAVLEWESASAKTYQLQISNDAKKWHVVHFTDACQGGKEEISFKPVEVRYIRMFGMERKTGWGYSMLEFAAYSSDESPVPLEKYDPFSAATILKLAQESPRTYYGLAAELSSNKYYPMWLNKEQGYFTIAGSYNGFHESAVCEDGTIDAGHKKYSVIPYLYVGGKLIGAGDCEMKFSLEESYLPMPGMEWKYKNLILDQKVFVQGDGEEGTDFTYIRYILKNRGKEPVDGKLYLTIRPFEVNPVWMNGGFVDLFRIENIGENIVEVNGADILYSLDKPNGFGALSYQDGDIMSFLDRGVLPPGKNAYDPLGGATGAFEFKFHLPPNQEKEYFFVMPLDQQKKVEEITRDKIMEVFKNTKSFWQEKLNKVKFGIPDPYISNVLRSNVAYILLNKDGDALQPGSRNYERTWVRDGSDMALSILRLGLADDVKKYINWVVKNQLLRNGEILPMINADGSSWDWGKTLNEFDGQGCFIYLIAEYYRFTKDIEFLKEKFPAIMKAVGYIQYLRKQELRDELKNGSLEKKRFYGLLPISVSHEGYVAPGVHSYWDDFYALKGLKDAGEMALALGKKGEYSAIKKEEEDLRKCFLDSVKNTQEFKKIDYIPGSADLGDMDATSTAIAVWPTEESRHLSQKDLMRTLDKYYNETFLPVRMDGKKKTDLTPYEMRMTLAYLMLGEKEKALAVFNYFLTLIRPKEWNHWAEAVHFKYREPKYVGDMPHSWEGSIFINMVRNMFAYEKDGALILGAGIDEKWLEKKEGVWVKELPTHFGNISYAVKLDGNALRLEFSGGANPDKGFIFKSPFLKRKIEKVTLNGRDWKKFSDNEATFDKLPREMLLTYYK